MQIPWTSLGVRMIDCYFDQPGSEVKNADILRCLQMKRSIPGARCTPFGTLVIDLTRSADQIFSDMNRVTRRMIKKAERDDGITWEALDVNDPSNRDAIAQFFDRCRTAKNLPPVSRALLSRLAAHRALAISIVRSEDKEVLAAGSFVVTPHRVRILYGAAIFREASTAAMKGLISRAGRLIWWKDILHFQQRGVSLFDFGGFYLGKDDPEKLHINAYKLGFGGEVREEFNCEMGMTVKGKLALWAHQQMAMRKERKRIGQSIPAEVPG